MALKLFCYLVLALIALPWPAHAAVMCPPALKTTQSIKTPHPGWEAGINSLPSYLANVTVYNGPPEERASLVPDSTDKNDKRDNDIWNLEPDPHGYWITCGYANTSIILTQKLAANIRRCQVRYEPDVSREGQEIPESMKCE